MVQASAYSKLGGFGFFQNKPAVRVQMGHAFRWVKFRFDQTSPKADPLQSLRALSSTGNQHSVAMELHAICIKSEIKKFQAI